MPPSDKATALAHLRTALGDPSASFRDGQWESIEQLLARKRVLVVQRTGWGKSMVYFLATKLLRDKGAGPTLLISPLLSLMRNQIEAASKIGVTARTINSTNTGDWEVIQGELEADTVDILLVSPERLANDEFRDQVLSALAGNIGLFVVDEAHCISDWGHDFRPDYRRIVRVLDALPSNIPVLATTATANDRVVGDVESQLGDGIELQRGSLVRKSLKLQNIDMPSPAARLAWLAKIIPTLDGSGIIYTLTQRDADRVSEWLQTCGIDAKPYHAGIPDPDDDTSARELLEQELLANEVKVLVSTVALGMGFDKPDLSFVIHFQRPASVVHYYQQVGRAGRSISDAHGVLLGGEEDDNIASFFIQNAFPHQTHVAEILEALDNSEDGLSIVELQKELNLSKSRLDNAIRFLTAESPSPIVKIESKWNVTPAARGYLIDEDHVESISAIRYSEQDQMKDYMQHNGCLMSFLQTALDDPSPSPCGRCQACSPGSALSEEYDIDLANRAGLYLRRSYQPIKPRKQWPMKDMFRVSDLSGYNIPVSLLAEDGRALSLWRDAGWGEIVSEGKYQTGRFDDRLVVACKEMLSVWAPDPTPEWVTCIPSKNHPELVPDFARRLADALGLTFIDCIEKIQANRQQKTMNNSFQQAQNLDGVFKVSDNVLPEPCLLIDDMVDSRWTFTIAAALLRQAGCTGVYPMALALNSPRMD